MYNGESASNFLENVERNVFLMQAVMTVINSTTWYCVTRRKKFEVSYDSYLYNIINSCKILSP